jgi:hypothetical protein
MTFLPLEGVETHAGEDHIQAADKRPKSVLMLLKIKMTRPIKLAGGLYRGRR